MGRVLRAIVGGKKVGSRPLFGVKAPVSIPTADVENVFACEVDLVERPPHPGPKFAVRSGIFAFRARLQAAREIDVVVPSNFVDLLL